MKRDICIRRRILGCETCPILLIKKWRNREGIELICLDGHKANLKRKKMYNFGLSELLKKNEEALGIIFNRGKVFIVKEGDDSYDNKRKYKEERT